MSSVTRLAPIFLGILCILNSVGNIYESAHRNSSKRGRGTVVTLRAWEKAGKIASERTKGGHRRYDLESILGYAKFKLTFVRGLY